MHRLLSVTEALFPFKAEEQQRQQKWLREQWMAAQAAAWHSEAFRKAHFFDSVEAQQAGRTMAADPSASEWRHVPTCRPGIAHRKSGITEYHRMPRSRTATAPTMALQHLQPHYCCRGIACACIGR